MRPAETISSFFGRYRSYPERSKRKKAKTGPASVPVLICAATKTRLAAFIELPDSLRVYVTKSLLDELDVLLGENHYTIKPNDDVPQPRKPWRRDKDAEPASA